MGRIPWSLVEFNRENSKIDTFARVLDSRNGKSIVALCDLRTIFAAYPDPAPPTAATRAESGRGHQGAELTV